MRTGRILLAAIAMVMLAGADAFAGGSSEAQLRAQIANLEQDAGYWKQLSALLAPVEMPLMTDHRAYMLPGGLVIALHFDDMDLSRAKNLNWVAIGVPGKYWKQDQERVEGLYGKGFTHFHDMMNDTHGGAPGADGVWFVHVAVREFDAPWGHVTPGVDQAFMPTPAPDNPAVAAAK